jgi:hypothetical protein
VSCQQLISSRKYTHVFVCSWTDGRTDSAADETGPDTRRAPDLHVAASTPRSLTLIVVRGQVLPSVYVILHTVGLLQCVRGGSQMPWAVQITWRPSQIPLPVIKICSSRRFRSKNYSWRFLWEKTNKLVVLVWLPPSVVLPRDPWDPLLRVPVRPRAVDFYGW